MNPVFAGSLLLLSCFPLLVSTPVAAFAGTICGTVRDALTSAPVTRAGVFVLDPVIGPTGLQAATDVAGHYCIDGIPAGVYDLEVRVDDYETRFIRGVVVTDAPVDVPVWLQSDAVWLGAPFPSPARDHVSVRFAIAAPGVVVIAIHDAAGRRVHGWTDAVAAGVHTLRWELPRSSALPSGFYHFILEANGERAARSFLRIR